MRKKTLTESSSNIQPGRMMPARDADAHRAKLSADERATLEKARKAIRAAPTKVAKSAEASDVETLLRGLKHPLKKEIEATRLIILGASAAVSDGVKWNAPSFRTKKEWFATINLRAKESVQVIFHLGAKARAGLKAFEVADPKGLIKWLGKDRMLVTLGAERDIPTNRKALEAIVRAWLKHV